MMKKISLLLLITTLFFTFTFTVEAKTLNTIQDYREALADLKAEKAAADKKKQQTESQIKQNQNNVKSANDEIVNAQNKLTLLNDEIANNEEKIKNLEAEISELLILYQKLSNENVYVKYATGATSMTELIMRLDAIKQVTDFNNQKINEAEQLIISNSKMQKELAKYQQTLNEKIAQYEVNISNLGVELKELVDEYEDYPSQIKGYEDLIKMYKDIGCGETENINTCLSRVNGSSINNSGWLRPFSRGKITSGWGYRIHPTKGTWKFHNGIDISDSGILGRNVYATATGIVGKITRKASCGGNMIYIWVYVNGKAYTTVYMHLLDIKVSVGDVVTTNTIIGTVGGSKSATPWDTCTTGAHLHYGVSTGHYLGSGPDGYKSYSTYISRSINPPGFPGVGAWFYSR